MYSYEANEPTVFDVDSAGDWSAELQPYMDGVGPERLACSQASDEFQRRYTLQKDSDGEVVLTYQRHLREKKTYPREFIIGQHFVSRAHGAGMVIATTYVLGQKAWSTEISYHNRYTNSIVFPVHGIKLFPGTPPNEPVLAPIGEKVSSD